MADVANLQVVISADTKDAITSMNTFSDKMQGIGQKMATIGVGMSVALTAPIVLAGKAMFGAASDFAESVNKVEVSFGDASDEVKAFAKTALENFGIAEGSALEMASLFGDMGTSMGVSTKDAAKMSKGMVGLAGDLASFKNVQIDVAQTALAGIFTGETESLKRLGIVMTEANLEQFALSKGMKTAYADMTQAEKVQLRYAYVTESSSNAVGDFARTSDSAANQTRTMSEALKEASTEFGQELLPLIVPIIRGITNMVKWFGSLDSNVKLVIIVIAGLVAVLGPVLSIMGSVLMVVGAMTPAMLAMVAPIAAVVAGIVALITIGVLLYKNWDAITEYAGKLWEGVKAGFVKIWDAIQEVFMTYLKGGVLGLVNDYIMKPFFDIDLFQVGKDIIQRLWDGLVQKWNEIKQFVADIGKSIADAMSGKSIGTSSYYTDYNAGKTTSLKTTAPATDYGVAGVKPVTQTVIINAPTALTPKVVAKETTKLAQALALGLY